MWCARNKYVDPAIAERLIPSRMKGFRRKDIWIQIVDTAQYPIDVKTDFLHRKYDFFLSLILHFSR